MACTVNVVIVEVPMVGVVVDGVGTWRSEKAGRAAAERTVSLSAVRNVQWGSAQES